mgnify:CR=1 FL=1
MADVVSLTHAEWLDLWEIRVHQKLTIQLNLEHMDTALVAAERFTGDSAENLLIQARKAGANRVVLTKYHEDGWVDVEAFCVEE